MSRRMLDTGIWANERFADLPPMGRLLLIGMISLADDQGRMKANPAFLRSQVFPYDDLSTDDVTSWLAMLEDNETIIVYSDNGKAYLQLLNPDWYGKNAIVTEPTEYGNDWPIMRQLALSRDLWQCRNCESDGPLEVHHIIPLRRGGTNKLNNLVTLCRTCHRGLHKRINREGLTREVMTWHVAE